MNSNISHQFPQNQLTWYSLHTVFRDLYVNECLICVCFYRSLRNLTNCEHLSYEFFLTGCFLSLSIVHQRVNVPSLIKGKYRMEMFLWMALEMNETCKVCSVHFCFYESKFGCFSITDGVLSDICINAAHIYDVSAVFVCRTSRHVKSRP